MKITKDNVEHFKWGDGCNGWWLLRSSGFHVIEESMPAGTFEKRHKHTSSDQFFYCLKGELVIELEGMDHHLKPQQAVFIEAGKTHKVKNGSNETANFLLISSPNSSIDRINLE